ncbi:ribosome recycling factor [bacterium]|nr:MAG: ribosome recycling factor [bacterium]
MMSTLQISLQNAIEFLEREFLTLRTGRANPAILDSVMVEAWGSKVPLNQVASISAPDATLIVVKPFDKSTLKDIEKGIQASDLGLNPILSEDIIRVPVPPLTQETREKLVKKAKEVAEEAKISVRKARAEAREEVQSMLKEKILTEDEAERDEKAIQKDVDDANKEIEERLKTKESSLMEV